MKQQKKQTKKEQLEREELIRERIKESQKYLAVLDTFGDDTIRNDFLNELNGADVYLLYFIIQFSFIFIIIIIIIIKRN
jgi:hypothetical protein